jgi:hypothetical protein
MGEEIPDEVAKETEVKTVKLTRKQIAQKLARSKGKVAVGGGV